MIQEKISAKYSGKVIFEEWRPIKRFENYYMISNTGRVKSIDRIGYQKNRYGTTSKYLHKGKILKTQQQKNGYITIDLHFDGNVERFFVHRLVAEAFLRKPYGKNYVNHKDNIKNNNCVNNLEWCTQSENIQYAYDNGRKEGPNKRKIMQCDMNNNVIKIWDSLADACRELNLYTSNISKVCQGKRTHAGGYKWKYVN